MTILRFFFDFTDGDRSTHDVDGHDLDGADAVLAEVARALPEVLLSDPGGRGDRHVACSVRDGAGAVVCQATITLAVRMMSNR